MADDERPAAIRRRVRSLLCYLPLAPVLLGEGRLEADHRARSAWLALGFHGAIACFTASWIALHQGTPHLHELSALPLLRFLGLAMTAWGLAWTILSLASGFAAVRGMRPPISHHFCLRARRMQLATSMLNVAVALLLVTALFLTARSRSLTVGFTPDAAAHYLHSPGTGPRFIHDLAALRLAERMAVQGERLSMDVLTPERLAAVAKEGRFLVIVSHGTGGRLAIGNALLGPDDVSEISAVPEERQAYFTACEAGLLAASWRERLSLGRLHASSRTTNGVEHARWLWTRAPGEWWASTLESSKAPPPPP